MIQAADSFEVDEVINQQQEEPTEVKQLISATPDVPSST